MNPDSNKLNLINQYYIFRSLALCFLLLFSYIGGFPLHAQDEGDKKIHSTNKSTMVGIGAANIYDTYLSPLKYEGWSVRILNERMKRNSWFDNYFAWQQLIELEFSSVQNPHKNVRDYSFMLGYTWGGHYNLIQTNKFRFSLGGLWNISGGVLYNQRNSNNPASARAFTNIHLSAIAFYNWKTITFRGQLSTPIIGMLFSPDYAQSYYEISLDKSIRVLNFASLHNQRALRAYLTADIPISKITLRAGYLGSFYQTKVHQIQTHNYTNNFIIGFVAESINLSGNKIKKSNLINSSFY